MHAATYKERDEKAQPGPRTPDTESGSRVVEFGIAFAAAAVVAQSLGHLIGVRLLDDRFLHLNADDELGLAAWTSAAATFAAAFGVLLLALLQETVDRWFVVLAGLLAFFSLDDAVVVHERAGEKVADALGYGEDAERLIWPLLFLPLFAGALLLLVYASQRLPARLGRLVFWGIGLFVVAVAAELLSSVAYSAADVERGSWPDALQVIVEEGAELAGWIVVATAFLAAVLVRLDEDPAPERRRPAP